MWIDAFLRYVRYEKNYSSHTVLSYKRDLLQFEEYLSHLEDAVAPERAERDHVRGWAASLIETGNTARTVARKFSALRTFYHYLQKQGVVTESPMRDIVLPKIHKSLPSFVRPAEMDALLDEKAATAAPVRVIIRSTDGESQWSTVGVSTNVIEASLTALTDSVEYGIYINRE